MAKGLPDAAPQNQSAAARLFWITVCGAATSVILVGAIWALTKVVVAWNDLGHSEELTGWLQRRFGLTFICGLAAAVAVLAIASCVKRLIPRWLVCISVGTAILVAIELGALPFLRFVAPINQERLRFVTSQAERNTLDHRMLANEALELLKTSKGGEIPAEAWPAWISLLRARTVRANKADNMLIIDSGYSFNHYGYCLEKQKKNGSWHWSWWAEEEPDQVLTTLPITEVVRSFPASEDTASLPGDNLHLDQLPGIQSGEYRADPYLAAALALQTVGEAKASQILRKLCRQARGPDDEDAVFILCRMLFTARPGKEFRRPLIGAPSLLGGTIPKGWPLEPIELVDGVPFLIVRGYMLGGEAEPPESYLEYCLRNCDWRRERFAPRSPEAKRKALAKLLASPKWKRSLEDRERQFLSAQVN
jgi:hypothetical protein